MSKKYTDIMDTTFRDGFQSVLQSHEWKTGKAVEEAANAGITHLNLVVVPDFSLFFYLNENAFDMMDKFRDVVGPNANLQTLSRGINTVALDT